MIVLKIIGWVLLSLLALIVLALSVRVHVMAEYSRENTSLAVRWLFLKIPLYPTKKKPGGKPKKEKKQRMHGILTRNLTGRWMRLTEAPPKEEGGKKKENLLTAFYNAEGFEGVLTLLKKTCSYLKTFFGNLLYGVVVDEFYLDLRCTRSDAADTAVFYGEVCAAVFPLLGALAARLRLKKYDVNIYPDYIARFSDASFILRFHIVPIYFIGVTLAVALKMGFGVLLKILLPKKTKHKAQAVEIINTEEETAAS